MQKLFLFTHPSQLNEATSNYVSIISDAALNRGFKVFHVESLAAIPSCSNILVLESKSAFKATFFRPRSNVWMWMQGIFPEEARLHFSSPAREFLWNFFDKYALPKLKGVFYVSSEMRLHIESKYPKLALPYFEMPCANATLEERHFFTEKKYSRPSFVYAGSLHAWQCIDLTLNVFKEFRKSCPDAKLSVFTGEVDKATRIVSSHGLQGVDVRHVPLRELPVRLAEFKYGFILRDDHPVNHVATPTKVSTYMASGVIPIMTDAIHAFRSPLRSVQHKVMSKEICAQAISDSIIDLEHKAIDPQEVLSSYSKVFQEYFNLDTYSPAISDFFKKTGLNDRNSCGKK